MMIAILALTVLAMCIALSGEDDEL